MKNIEPQKYLIASEIAVKEGVASISLLQRRLRIGFTEARELVSALVEAKVLGAANPDGLYHVDLSLLKRMDAPESAAAVHLRMIHDLSWYMLENYNFEDTNCVQILTDRATSRNEVRAVVKSTMAPEPHRSLVKVAIAVARMPVFEAMVPSAQIEQALTIACASTEVLSARLTSSLDFRLRGLLYACCYLKRRIVQGLEPESRAVDVFVHKTHLPQGRAKGALLEKHGEHVVPCKFVQSKASELLRHGLPEHAVAEWIEPYLRIVWIEKSDAALLDGPMKLKTNMPKDWQFGRDCMYARLHSLGIDFASPEAGPECRCGHD